jgi:hypothetical protein
LSRERRVRLLLALGALAGLAAAGSGLLQRNGAESLPDGAVALVNGMPVRAADYERALAALASDRRNPVGDDERRFVLDRLVDEELLVQRALELGLVRHDRRVRNDLVSALIESVTTDAGQREPEPDEVRAFYDANRDYFARPGRLRVRQLWVRAAPDRSEEAARARAADAAARLRAGEAFDAVAAELGDAALAPLPDAPLPPAKLAEYLGPSALAALGALEVGALAGPLPAAGGQQLLLLVAREPAETPALAAIEPELRAELRRRAGDAALRGYLDELRHRAQVQIAGSAP